ncbi:MAG: hypothetical protein Q8O67_33315 [Deltaproteobacteria bacterium]|nr:hypothetical protein [Deltaproteobacteria bacterium]
MRIPSLPLALVVTLLVTIFGATAASAVEKEEVGDVTDSVVDDILTGAWLDPDDIFWAPRRGERFELSLLLGGEGSLGGVAPDKLPTIGGVVVNGIGRYYPVDRLAVIFGVRTYFGLDGAPASGTTASSVFSGITGVRYDLVRENRFSLLWDLYSGPSLYVFADLVGNDSLVTDGTIISVGGEMGTALAMRYSLGPFTGELRGLVGGRAGASASPFQRSGYDGGSGPFSSLYAGLDFGATWSM